MDDPLRMFLVLRRGAIATLERAAELAGAAAVACVRRFAGEPEFADAFADWAPRPGKVCLRARSPAQWAELLEQPHALDDREALTYVLNPRLDMSSGKVAAQAAHAAVLAAEALPAWAAAGAPGRLVAPTPAAFDALARSGGLAARVVDAGLTEVPPGTVTVVAWPPARPASLPAALRDDRSHT